MQRWACGATMVASGIAASISSIAETCCLPACPALRHCRVMRMDQQKFDAPAVPAIPLVQNAKMAGWWSAPALTGVSPAVSGIRPAWVKRRYRQWQVLQASRSHTADIWLAPGAQLWPFRITTVGNGLWNHAAAAKPCRSLKLSTCETGRSLPRGRGVCRVPQRDCPACLSHASPRSIARPFSFPIGRHCIGRLSGLACRPPTRPPTLGAPQTSHSLSKRTI